jgi:predicted nucleic acid-binding protein
MIAGHALALGRTLVSNNLRHFKYVHGLQVETWVQSDDQ